MDFYIGLLQVIGVHTLLGLSAWCILHTGQVSLAQGGFFAIGAYVAGMLTAMAGWPLGLALLTAALIASLIAIAIGFPALRVKGLMLVVATTAFAEIVRLVFFNLKWQVQTPNGPIGPDGGLGFGGIRYFPANAWSGLEILALIWSLVAAVMMALWLLDRSRIGTLWRAVLRPPRASVASRHRCDARRRHRGCAAAWRLLHAARYPSAPNTGPARRRCAHRHHHRYWRGAADWRCHHLA